MNIESRAMRSHNEPLHGGKVTEVFTSDYYLNFVSHEVVDQRAREAAEARAARLAAAVRRALARAGK